MEIYNRQSKNYIEVWMTNEEQQLFDRRELTKFLLSRIQNSRNKVVFYLSGEGDLYSNTENLLVRNIGCA